MLLPIIWTCLPISVYLYIKIQSSFLSLQQSSTWAYVSDQGVECGDAALCPQAVPLFIAIIKCEGFDFVAVLKSSVSVGKGHSTEAKEAK